jgi:CRISPR-associated endonuclease/helicase Cas3
MERSDSKAERLLQLEQVLLAHPEGLHKAEIARKLGVHRSTVGRYVDDLSRRIPIWQDGNRLGINRDDYLTHVRLTIHESMALHLAARLMATRTDKHNPHAASALRKLGSALEAFSPQVSRHLRASADVMDDAARRRDPVYLDVLETLTRAWSDGRMVRVCHRLESGQVYEYDFAPYFIEPYAVGQTSHVIGWRGPPQAIRTFKIERIQRADLIVPPRPYTIPDDFDPRETLADAWGIWYTEAEPVEVVLRFHPRVAHRVRETRWHRSERVEEQPDGSLIWSAKVAEPQEMLPWIRGWGADVEAIGPETLREALESEARRFAALYDVQSIPTYQLLWAKTSKDRTRTHLLLCHLIDVAQVALALWSQALTDSLRTQIAGALGLDAEDAGRLIAFWAGLHDLGKASPGFQRKYSPAVATLTEAGLSFPKRFAQESCYHGTITAKTLDTLLETETGLPGRAAKKVARAVGGHHGAWPTPGDLQTLAPTQIGDNGWDGVRRDLLRAMSELLPPVPVERLGATRLEENVLLTLLSGFTAAADWIGSMERYFPYVEGPVDPTRYAERAAAQAGQALEELGWIGWQPPSEPATFRDLFLFKPHPMQQTVVDLAEKLDRPALVIVEAPTGAGKTEAALYLGDHWARTCRQRGLYVAMPTMATSNQMFERVQNVLARRYPDDLVNLHLIHSQAQWSDDVQELRMETTDEREGGSVAALSWFLPRKRSLLAPFGVGTVDQSLLSVLQTRHFFVRLFGLSHKTVVFDEVHAYDTYMSTLFQHLLRWLRAVGASVVILSATLPERTRRELLQAYAGVSDVPPAPYPSITWAMEGQVGVESIEAPETRKLALEWIDREPNAIASVLEDALQEGGCAAVICNTVGRAQEVYQTLRGTDFVPQEHLILFHARFPFAWREAIEKEVLARFGKEGDRPRKAIVVATQVIEQSLDLDFDLMVSDLAPVDLILQRAGRLHRHERDGRPARVATPRMLVTRPDMRDGMPAFGRDAWVYEPYVLLRSYLALRDLDQLTLPDDTVSLIESVYGDGPVTADLPAGLEGALTQALQQMKQHEGKDTWEARTKLIALPEADNLLSKSNLGLAEDSPELHQAFQALTRLGPPSVSLVCLHKVDGELNTEPDGSGLTIDLAQKPNAEATGQLVRSTLAITHRGVVPYFQEQEPPPGWQDHPLLKQYRVAVFADGAYDLATISYALHLDRELGLIVEKRKS